LFLPGDGTRSTFSKKAGTAELHDKVFDHVGLLVNKPPGTARLLFVKFSEIMITPNYYARLMPQAGKARSKETTFDAAFRTMEEGQFKCKNNHRLSVSTRVDTSLHASGHLH
jgi:hypothetical protein